MRVIAGRFKGRRLSAPDTTATRPVTDKVKESVFSSLGQAVIEARVGDLYAGAGSFGIEALSRGARSVVFVERGRRACAALRSNLEALEVDPTEATLIVSTVERFLASSDDVLDLVFCDPPWDLDSVGLESILEGIRDQLDPDGQIIITRKSGDRVPEPHGLAIDDDRRHGDTRIIRYLIETETGRT